MKNVTWYRLMSGVWIALGLGLLFRATQMMFIALRYATHDAGREVVAGAIGLAISFWAIGIVHLSIVAVMGALWWWARPLPDEAGES